MDARAVSSELARQASDSEPLLTASNARPSVVVGKGVRATADRCSVDAQSPLLRRSSSFAESMAMLRAVKARYSAEGLGP